MILQLHRNKTLRTPPTAEENIDISFQQFFLGFRVKL
jgi:hypothetical protein